MYGLRRVALGGLGKSSADTVCGPTIPWGICGRGRIFEAIRGNSIFVADDVSDGSVSWRKLEGYPRANGSDIRRVGEKASWFLRCIEPEDEDEDEAFGPVCRTDDPREEPVMSKKEYDS